MDFLLQKPCILIPKRAVRDWLSRMLNGEEATRNYFLRGELANKLFKPITTARCSCLKMHGFRKIKIMVYNFMEMHTIIHVKHFLKHIYHLVRNKQPE